MLVSSIHSVSWQWYINFNVTYWFIFILWLITFFILYWDTRHLLMISFFTNTFRSQHHKLTIVSPLSLHLGNRFSVHCTKRTRLILIYCVVVKTHLYQYKKLEGCQTNGEIFYNNVYPRVYLSQQNIDRNENL